MACWWDEADVQSLDGKNSSSLLPNEVRLPSSANGSALVSILDGTIDLVSAKDFQQGSEMRLLGCDRVCMRAA